MSHTANTAIDWKKLEVLAQQQLPPFVLDRAPNLVAFLEAYYEWLDAQDNPNYSLRNLRHWRDVDRTLDRFVDWFHGEFLVRIPKDVLADRRLLVHHIKQFYRSKGSQKSYKFLFRILYNEDLEFYYPGRDMLRFSDAPWIVEKFLKLELLVTEEELFALEGEEIRGNTSEARSLVEKLTTTTTLGIPEYFLYYGKTVGTFSNNEIIRSGNTNIAKVVRVDETEGYYAGSEGFSSLKKIQDSWYYQEYSYELQSGIVINEYRDIVSDLVHPSGTKLFGKFSFTSVFNVFSELTGTGFDTQPYAVRIEPTVITQIPEVISAVGFGGDAAALILLLIPITMYETTVRTPSYIYINGAQLTGYFRIANNDTFTPYEDDPIGWYDEWTEETFTDGRGCLGTGTLWESEIPIANTFFDGNIIFDGQYVHANSLHGIIHVGSNTTTKMSNPYYDNTSANLYFYPRYYQPTFSFSLPVGTFLIANSLMSTFDSQPMGNFDDWSMDDLESGRGLVGNGTIWETDLINCLPPPIGNLGVTHIDPIIIDGDGVYSNSSFTMAYVDSNTSARMSNSYFDLTSANLSFKITTYV